MTTDIYRWCFEIPLSDVQTTEEDTTASCCCFLCGKPMKEGQAKFMVHYLTNGNLVSTDEDMDNSQGLFPIGNECRKKLPNNFYFPIK